jgi:hypothetical protein
VATLLDTIKNKMKSPQEQVQPELGKTQQAQRLLRAKSGKAAAPQAGPRASALKERMAAQATEAGAEELRQTGEVQAEQLEQREQDIAQREVQQQAKSEQAFKQSKQQFEQKSHNLLNELERAGKDINAREYKSNLEQLGFNMRLQNDQYLNRIKQEGQKARLDNGLEFKAQLAQEVFDNNKDILEDKISFKQLIEADDRTFTRELADMDINYAVELADKEIEGIQTRQVATGLGGAVKGGIEAAEKAGMFKTKETPNPKGTPNNGQ